MDQIALELMENQTKKIELLNQVLLSTQKQKEYIEKDDSENLNLEIDKRQKYLNDLLLLNEDLERLRQLYALKLKGGSITLSTGLHSMEEEIKRINHSIQKLNDENNSDAQEKLEDYRKHIAELTKRKKGFESYAHRYIKQDGMYIDKKK